MHADKIRLLERIFKRDVLDPGFFFRNAPGEAEGHRLLNCFHVVMVLIRRIVAENVHIESGAFLDHCQPDSPRANDGDGLAGNFVAQKRQVRMPEPPFVLARQMF